MLQHDLFLLDFSKLIINFIVHIHDLRLLTFLILMWTGSSDIEVPTFVPRFTFPLKVNERFNLVWRAAVLRRNHVVNHTCVLLGLRKEMANQSPDWLHQLLACLEVIQLTDQKVAGKNKQARWVSLCALTFRATSCVHLLQRRINDSG